MAEVARRDTRQYAEITDLKASLLTRPAASSRDRSEVHGEYIGGPSDDEGQEKLGPGTRQRRLCPRIGGEIVIIIYAHV